MAKAKSKPASRPRVRSKLAKARTPPRKPRPAAATRRAAQPAGAVAREELIRHLAPDGRLLAPATAPGDDTALALLRGMLRIRRLDDRMLRLQRQGRIGFYGQCTGQEAAIVGSAAAIGAQDWVVPALREAGVAVWRGLPLERLVAQCMGKASEPSRGRQMPCHHTWRAGRFVSMSSVIATQIAHAAGIAMAARIRRDPIVVLGYLGDGATSEHDFHCGLNFAAVFQAPVVFVCQNNQWAISVPVSRQTASRSIAIKAGAYGMPGVRVDGNDVFAMLAETRRAVERARGGGGPTLIEAVTYRRTGHSSSDDPTRYRSNDEVAAWERLDPIDRLRRHLAARGLLAAEEEERIESAIEAEISAAIAAAEQGADPGPSSLFDDVFAEPTAQLEEQRAALLSRFPAQDPPRHGGS